MDFIFTNQGGSILLLFPHTDAAKQWIKDNLSKDVMKWGKSVVVEPRFMWDIIGGIESDGLTVQY